MSEEQSEYKTPEQKWYVDIPNHQNIGIDSAFMNIGEFDTREEALKWMRDNIDAEIDDSGNLRILTTG